ncbi:MAG: ATP synthase F1 subunit gamma [bacterium]|nr:ATP synthase F1 subunit gamma [bacterium]
MAMIRNIKSRIKAIKNTSQITRTMMLVAAAKMNKAHNAVKAARPYSYDLQRIMANLALRAERDIHPLLAEREVKKAGLVILTSNRGLCGAFNSNVVKRAVAYLQESSCPATMMTIGRRGNLIFSRRDVEIGDFYLMPEPVRFEAADKVESGDKIGSADEIGTQIIERFLDGTWDAVDVIYNKAASTFKQEITLERLLPLTPAERETKYLTDYLYEPSAGAILESILVRHIKTQIYRMMLESVASEHSARMVSMDSATKNAKKMIDHLLLSFNRARQASVTKEVTEIVGGMEALK